MMRWGDPPSVLTEIYNTNLSSEPTGPALSQSVGLIYPVKAITYWGRHRFWMTFVTLHAGTIYAIVSRPTPSDAPIPHFWKYDKDNSYYPRGNRLFSLDDGATWTSYPDSDHIFAEFGNPPLPSPDPPPPINNFAPLNIIQTLTPDGVIITLSTNVPCHLTCYWTDKHPLKHKTSRTDRGLPTLTAIYYCFVAWQTLEQSELGDTMYHTFVFSPWPVCETRWFTFKGNVADIESPSIGPIFTKHLTQHLPLAFDLRPIAPGIQCLISTEVGQPCPNHWANLNDTFPDGDSSMIWHSIFEWKHDLYTIETPSLPIYTPTKVTLCGTFKKLGPHVITPLAQFAIRTHSTTYLYAILDTPIFDWQLFTHDLILNPFTGISWTPAEILDLQIGVGLGMYQHAGINYSTAACTQVYVNIPFTP